MSRTWVAGHWAGQSVKRMAVLVSLLLLVSCATKPSAPPDCEGELVPINGPMRSGVPGEVR